MKMRDSLGRTAVVLSLAALCGAPALAQTAGSQAGATGASAAIPVVPQTELTETSAKGAIDAFLAVKEKYGEDTPALDTSGSAAERYAALQGVEGIVGGHGFSNTGQWHTALVSVALAYGFAKEGKTEELDEAIAEIRANTQVPDNLKQQMIAMIAGVRPSENNLAVVKGLMGDSGYAAKLAEITK